jgi:hypothetical protein
MKWHERAGPMAREHAGLLHRVGALMQPAGNREEPEPPRAGELQDEGIDELHARVKRLEEVVEGLQDALYRHARHQDDRIEELQRSMDPEQLARALSADARRRGL